jgi:hypothetical protein
MNNPLMFNDPNGECFVPLFGVLVASWVAGAVVGTMVAAGMFILKSLVNGTWSWGGFARSLLIGAVTGAATGGLTGGMSASGFQGAVIVGSMNGAISGGVDALFNKENFFTGMYRGAIFGAATAGIVSGISWVVNQLSTRTIRFYMEDNEINTLESGTPVGNRSYARDLYEKFGVQDGLNKNSIYNDASRLGGKMNADGAIEYTYKGKITKALGVTDVRIDKYGKRVGKIRIFLSNKAFASREQLAYVMQHELNHVRIANAGLSNIAEQSIKLTSKIAQKYSDLLDNVGHYHIQESGSSFLENNGWHNIQSTVPSEVFNSMNFQMGNEQIWKLLQGTDKKININFK